MGKTTTVKKSNFNTRNAKDRTTNAPVKTILKAKSKPPTKSAVNTKAIMTLSKQVRSLQLAKIGLKQFQHQHLTKSDGTDFSFKVSKDYPRAFCLNNFYANAPFYYGYITPALIPSSAIEMFWTPVNAPQDIGASYLFNHKQSEDMVAPDHYLPIKTSVNFTIKYQTGPSISTVRLRFTVFKVKNLGKNIHTELPANIGAYRNMMDDDPTTRNYFNTHQHHTIISDTYVTLRQTDAVRNDQIKKVTITTQLPPKLLTPEITTTDPALQSFNTNVPTKDQIWMLISSDSQGGDSMAYNIYGERWNTWRDNAGSGS